MAMATRYKSKKYGVDLPPPGCPVVVKGEQFKGFTFTMCTEMIMQLLEAQGLDPLEHFAKEDEKAEEGAGEEVKNEPEQSPRKKKN